MCTCSLLRWFLLFDTVFWQLTIQDDYNFQDIDVFEDFIDIIIPTLFVNDNAHRYRCVVNQIYRPHKIHADRIRWIHIGGKCSTKTTHAQQGNQHDER